ncbi:MAG: MFS transporter, partial [Pseudomonadota bacterium]|nr:MFS transporter [Pseudomonadota bacterium]
DCKGVSSMQGKSGRLVVVLAVVTLVQALLSMAVLSAPSIAPVITSAYEIGVETVGYQISLIYLAASVGSFGSGVVVRRYGPARTSMVSLVMAAVGLALMATGVVGIAVVASVLIGLGYALTNPSAGQILDRHCGPEHRNFVFSLKQTAVPIGGIAAGLILPALAEGVDWRMALAVPVCLCLLACLVVAPFRESWDVGREPNARFRGSVMAGIREVRQNPGLRSLAIVAFCFAAMQLSLMSYIVSTLVVDLGWTRVAAGGMTAAVQVCGAVGRLTWGGLADWWGRPMRVLLVIGLITTVAAGLMPLLKPDTPLVLVALLLAAFGFASIGWNGILLADIARHVPQAQVGSASGGVMATTFAGVVVGPAIFAVVHMVTRDFALSFLWLAIFPLLGAIVALRAPDPGPVQRKIDN